MANDKVSVEISIEEKQALKALTQLTKGVENFEKSTVNSVKKTDSAMSSFKGNLAAIATSGAISAIGSGLKSLVVGSFEAAAATEKLTTQFEVLTGSTEVAANLFQELTDFSASTPFQLNNIAEAGAQLLSFGFAADTVRDRIAKIGEVAAGSNSDLKEVALIYGQVAAAGKLSGERLLQFQERAVPIGAALAESLGVAESEVKDLVSAGVVGFPEFEKAFNSMSEAGGLFEGAIDKQSQTINGSISTMTDNFAILQTEIGKTFAPDVVVGIKLITQSLQDFTGAVVENKDGIAIAIGFVRDYVTVYLNLAATLVKSETPLSKVDAQIEKVALSMSSLAEKKADLESSATARFFSPINLKEVNGLLDKQEKKLASLVAQRNKLGDDKQNDKEIDAISAEFAQFEAEEKAKAPLVAVENAKILEERAKLTSELAVLKEEQLIKEAEAKIAADELGIEGKTLELENVLSHELAKSKITQDAELERNKKIRDAQSKKLADDKTNAKAQIAVTAAEAKAKIAIDLAKAKHDAAMNAGYLKAVNIATSITKEGTAEHKALSIISATISTYTAAARAMEDYPFPANVAVAGLTTIAGLKNVKEITKASFNTGGVVGGFSGATNGLDNTSANVRTGEMILNANQQKQLFDIAAGRGSQASENRLIEITSIVQVDEREIARAVRNQRIEGFA